MIENFEMSFSGLEELYNAMDDLPDKVKDSILRSINTKLAKKHIVDRIKTETPYSAKSKKNVKIYLPDNDKTAVTAGPTEDIFWWRFVEEGTKERFSKNKKSKGRILPRNIIGPIIESSIDPLVEDWEKNVGDMIIEAIEKRIRAGERKLSRLK